ncbi:MAG TPA: class I SAM-dependent methyltransferase [Gemmataceae bacterium]|jgi:SAM-dependent methyltransferase|nr:class I SAM-dependent methyltransferase [Gemmataceae bacterium]
MKQLFKRWMGRVADAFVRRISESDQLSDNIAKMVMMNALLTGATPKKPHCQLFGEVSDDFWFWLNTEGYRKSASLRALLPGLPEEKKQLNFTGLAGDSTLSEGFAAYQIFKRLFEEHVGELNDSRMVLDFGCGWGRIIRFFMKEVAATNLWGIDCYEEMIEISRKTNPWCRFQKIEPRPPVPMAANSFDMIYCFSVFSHLAEDIHNQWLAEFQRLLKPGGLLIATTRGREYIQTCDAIMKSLPSWWPRPTEPLFDDVLKELAKYDNGGYCFSPVGGGGPLEKSFFGETCISKGYVLKNWSRRFTFLDFIEDREVCAQNIIVVKK